MKNKNKAPLTRGLSAKLTGGSGITLIALIITIIVMLILAVVSIKVASDSGLFSKAETAASETEKEKIREQLQDIIVDYYDIETGYINTTKTINGKTLADRQNEIDTKGIFTISNLGNIDENTNRKTPKDYEGILEFTILDSEARTVSVKGGGYRATQWDAPTLTGDIVIPKTINISDIEYTITEIENSGFGTTLSNNNCTITSVKIPNTVTTIGENAFEGCSKLINIEIPPSVTKIGMLAFYNTPWIEEQRQNNAWANKVIIVNGILIDGNECSGNVELPLDVKEINELAFWFNTSVNKIIIPGTIEKISDSAFYGSSSITEIKILKENDGSITGAPWGAENATVIWNEY